MIDTNTTLDNLDLKDPKVYEIGYLLVPLVPEADKLQIVEMAITSVIKGKGGVVINEIAPDMRKLEYTIRKMMNNKYAKFSDAYFGSIKFELNPAEVSSINEAVKKSDHVLRYILIESSINNEAKSKPTEGAKKTTTTSKIKTEDNVVDGTKDDSTDTVKKVDPESKKVIDQEIEDLLTS
ncbi:MAG: 30S ribosomal protein S6 [Candidatus Paceibacterota bacterium]